LKQPVFLFRKKDRNRTAVIELGFVSVRKMVYFEDSLLLALSWALVSALLYSFMNKQL
jgi:hypothetical protein